MKITPANAKPNLCPIVWHVEAYELFSGLTISIAHASTAMS